MKMPHFVFSGTSYEQGLAHGEALKQSIKKNIDFYFDRFQNETLISKKVLIKKTKLCVDKLQVQSQDYFNAIKGISDGASLDLMEIAMLNFRYELLYHATGKQLLENTTDGCTSFAIEPNNCSNGSLLIGQNWDWIPEIECVLIKSLDEDGTKRMAFTEAGIFGGKPGMNSFGIGLTVNGMHSINDDWKRLEKPFHLRCYDVLRQQKITDSINCLQKTPRSCTANFLIGQSPAKLINIELAPNKMNIIHPEKSILVHANHLAKPNEVEIIEPNNPRRFLSEFRHDRMNNLLVNHNKLDIYKIKKILRDHENYPHSLCRHRDNNLPSYQHTITKTAIIMDLNCQKLWLTNGQPCKNKFEEYDFN